MVRCDRRCNSPHTVPQLHLRCHSISDLLHLTKWLVCPSNQSSITTKIVGYEVETGKVESKQKMTNTTSHAKFVFKHWGFFGPYLKAGEHACHLSSIQIQIYKAIYQSSHTATVDSQNTYQALEIKSEGSTSLCTKPFYICQPSNKSQPSNTCKPSDTC